MTTHTADRRAKISETMRMKAQAGTLKRRAPFGWKNTSLNKPHERVAEEQALIEKIVFLSETMRIITIVRLLNQDEEALRILHARGEKSTHYYSLLIDKIIRRTGHIPFRPPPKNCQRSMYGVA